MRQRTQAWHRARRGKFSASRFGVAAGLHPNISPIAVWKEMTGRKEVVITEAMQYGIDNETTAIDLFEKETGLIVEEQGFILYDKNNDYGCSPDGFTDGGLIEVKCPMNGHYEAVPEWYQAQIQGQMEITDRPFCFFVTYYEKNINITKVARDTNYWQTLFPKLQAFWKHVQTNTQPPRRKKGKLNEKSKIKRELPKGIRV